MLVLHPAHPSLRDLNALFDAKNIERTREYFEKLGGRYQLGQLAGAVPGISEQELRRWRAEIRSQVPALVKAVLRDVILYSLTNKGEGGGYAPIPIKFVLVEPKARGGRTISIVEQRGRLTVELSGIPGAPGAKKPAPKTPALRRPRRTRS
jgi:hypothetical protein